MASLFIHETETIADAVQNISRLIPPGWDIEIRVDGESAGVTLHNTSGEDVEYPSNYECFLDELNDALDHARKCEETDAN